MMRLSTMLHRRWIFPCNKEKQWKVQIVPNACSRYIYPLLSLHLGEKYNEINFGLSLLNKSIIEAPEGPQTIPIPLKQPHSLRPV
jgi:hypothetical protein